MFREGIGSRGARKTTTADELLASHLEPGTGGLGIASQLGSSGAVNHNISSDGNSMNAWQFEDAEEDEDGGDNDEGTNEKVAEETKLPSGGPAADGTAQAPIHIPPLSLTAAQGYVPISKKNNRKSRIGGLKDDGEDTTNTYASLNGSGTNQLRNGKGLAKTKSDSSKKRSKKSTMKSIPMNGSTGNSPMTRVGNNSSTDVSQNGAMAGVQPPRDVRPVEFHGRMIGGHGPAAVIFGNIKAAAAKSTKRKSASPQKQHGPSQSSAYTPPSIHHPSVSARTAATQAALRINDTGTSASPEKHHRPSQSSTYIPPKVRHASVNVVQGTRKSTKEINRAGPRPTIVPACQPDDIARIEAAASIRDLSPHDVLCGPDMGVFPTAGNVFFERLIRLYQERFRLLKARGARQLPVVNYIYSVIANLNPPGRFMAHHSKAGWMNLVQETAEAFIGACLERGMTGVPAWILPAKVSGGKAEENSKFIGLAASKRHSQESSDNIQPEKRSRQYSPTLPTTQQVPYVAGYQVFHGPSQGGNDAVMRAQPPTAGSGNMVNPGAQRDARQVGNFHPSTQQQQQRQLQEMHLQRRQQLITQQQEEQFEQQQRRRRRQQQQQQQQQYQQQQYQQQQHHQQRQRQQQQQKSHHQPQQPQQQQPSPDSSLLLARQQFEAAAARLRAAEMMSQTRDKQTNHAPATRHANMADLCTETPSPVAGLSNQITNHQGFQQQAQHVQDFPNYIPDHGSVHQQRQNVQGLQKQIPHHQGPQQQQDTQGAMSQLAAAGLALVPTSLLLGVPPNSRDGSGGNYPAHGSISPQIQNFGMHHSPFQHDT